MRFFLRYWYDVGLVAGLLAIVFLVVLWHEISVLQRLLLLNFAALTLHQFEEYGWPGGFPWIMNDVFQPKGGPADRYPLNQKNAFVINVVMAWPFYLVPVFFPDVIWLGLAPTVFGLAQFIGHGVIFNRMLKSIYSPGLVAVMLGHVPLGIWYLVEVCTNGKITVWDWVFGAAYIACFIVVGMRLIGFRLLVDKNSPYPFAPEEMDRFDRPGHLSRLRTTCPSRRSAVPDRPL